MPRNRSVLIIITALVLALPALAQMPTGTLTGRVTDGNAVLPGVTVTITSANLQGEKIAISSGNGDYLFPYLPPGDYRVVFTMPSFQTVEANIRVSAGQTAQVDAVMPLAQLAEEIVVTGSRETISTTIQAASTIEKALVDDLPVLNRNLYNITQLSPAVSATGPGQTGRTNYLVVSGAPSYQNLYTVNGVTIQDNVRNNPFNLYIEDAIQETTVSTSGISAEYGRFSGGVIAALTKSGGNELSGSFRTNLDNETWTRPTPLTTSREDKTNLTYEVTLGGKILADRLWYFVAARSIAREGTGQTFVTNIPYPTGTDEKRYEGKLTYAVTPEHRVVGSYMKVKTHEVGNVFYDAMDLRSVDDRDLPQELLALHYTGAFGTNLFTELQYSNRKYSFVGSGSDYRDLIYGTLLVNRANSSQRWWSPTFCGVCDAKQRNNEEVVAKGTYFLSTPALGSHDVTFGLSRYDDQRNENNFQSGSDFRIYANPVFVGQDIYTRLVPNSSYLMWNPIALESVTSHFKTNSIFVNDKWRLSANWSFNVGLRWDENDGKDEQGTQVIKDSKISPRLGVAWDPTGEASWLVNASYSTYVMSIANSIANSQSAAARPATYTWTYTGPAINAAEPYLQTEQVLEQFWTWFNSIGGTSNTNYRSNPTIPGVNTLVDPDMASPDVTEWALGATKRIGTSGLVRADLIHREYGDFYADRVDMSTGSVQPPYGNRVDLTVTTTDDSGRMKRTYDGIQVQGQYRRERWNLGGYYTLSWTKGNIVGENTGSGPITSLVLYYPEYRAFERWEPEGYLSADQRHRIRLYLSWDAIAAAGHRLNVTLLQSYASGMPYGANGAVDSRPYVTNPGYMRPPSTVGYWYTDRDAYRTDAITSTDLALNYSFSIGALGKSIELYVQPTVLNVFNEDGVINVNTTVYDRTTDTTLQAFNPFTDAAQEGVHWRKGDNFGQPTNDTDYQRPRTFQLSIGVRF